MHFQSITEWLTPYDAVFTFSKSAELSDSALLSSCSLHAAASSKSSNDPNALGGLAGISEDASEGQQNGKQTKVQVEGSNKREKASPSLGGGGTDDYNDENRVNRTVEAKHEPSRGHQRSRTLSNANKNLPLTPNHSVSKHANSSTAFESGEFDTEPSVEARMSTQSERPSARDINRAYEYKQKVKLGPRPSIDLGTRPEIPGMGRDSIRPKATLPAGLRMPTRKPAPGPMKAHPSPKSHSEKSQAHLTQLSTAAPPPIATAPLSDGKLLFTNHESNVFAGSLDLRPPKMTPEKKRLMKALQIRQKHIEAQNAAKGLGISMEHGEENAPEAAETDGDFPLMPESTDIPEKKPLEMEQTVQRAHDIQDSPYSVQETSEGLSTRASSIHDEEVSNTLEQDPLSESKENESSKAPGEGDSDLNGNMEHLVEEKHAHHSRGSDVHNKDEDDTKDFSQSSDLPVTLSMPLPMEEIIPDDRKPNLQAGHRLSGLSSSTVETIVRQPHTVRGAFSSDGENSISSAATAGSQATTPVQVENANPSPTPASNSLAIKNEKPDSLGADTVRHTPSATSPSGESNFALDLHSSPENTTVDAPIIAMIREGTSEHLKANSNPDSLPERPGYGETVQAMNLSKQEHLTGTGPELGSFLGRDRLGSFTEILIPDALAITGSETLSATDYTHSGDTQETRNLPEQGSSSQKVQEHKLNGETEHAERDAHTATRSFLLPRSPSLSSEEQDQPQASGLSMEPWSTATGPSLNKQTNGAAESTVAELPDQASEGLMQKLSKAQEGYGPGDLTERRARRRGLVNPIHKSVSEQSEEQFLSDDSFMEELKRAKVEEAKPMSVSKSPIKPVFSRSESDYRLGEGLRTSRNVSSPLDCRTMDDASASSPPRPAPLTIRSFSAISQPKFDAFSPVTSQGPQAKKTGVSTGISQRIKALEKLSSRPNSPITPSSSTPSFLNFPKSSFLSSSGSSDINTGFAGRHRPSTASASPVSPESAAPNPFSQSFSPTAESISVTATIVREPEKRSDFSLDGSQSSNLNLYQSPLKVERQSKESASRQVMGPPPPPTPRSPIKTPRPKNSRYSSARSVDSASTDHKGENSQATRRSSFASKRSQSSRNGSDVDLPRSMSEKSLSSNGLNGIHEEKKESRGSRLLKRMSSVTSASRRSIAQAISPSRKTEAIREQQEPTASSRGSTSVDLGDVNVQFPDNLVCRTSGSEY